jgi:hypothetical protein
MFLEFPYGDANQRFRDGHSRNKHAKFDDRKPGRISRQSQAIVAANESPPQRPLFTPDERSSELEAVRCSQRILVQRLYRQVTNLVGGQDFPPSTTEQLQTGYGTSFVRVRDVLITMETAYCAMNFCETSPPNYRRESSKM